MDFDFSISDEVPLWKTFDYLIETEQPKTVLNFLSLYSEQEVLDIFNKSVSLPSLFCFDKVIGLDYYSIEKISKYAHELNREYLNRGYFESYGIYDRFIKSLLHNQYIDPIVKKDLMRGFSLIPMNYLRLDYTKLIRFENKLVDYIVEDNIPEFLNNIDEKVLSNIKYCINGSVFYFRIMQKSVLENVNDDVLNYLVFDSIEANMSTITKNVLFSNISSSAKILYLFRLLSLGLESISLGLDSEIVKSFARYFNMKNVEEILMNLDLDSSINIQLLMLVYIGSKCGRKIIKQIYDLDNNFLERNFPIGNLPEHKDFIDLKI